MVDVWCRMEKIPFRSETIIGQSVLDYMLMDRKANLPSPYSNLVTFVNTTGNQLHLRLSVNHPSHNDHKPPLLNPSAFHHSTCLASNVSHCKNNVVYHHKNSAKITTWYIAASMKVRVISYYCIRAPSKFSSKHIPNTVVTLHMNFQATFKHKNFSAYTKGSQ